MAAIPTHRKTLIALMIIGVAAAISAFNTIDLANVGEAVPGVSKHDSLMNAPVKDSDYFKVPRVVDKG